MITFKQYLQEEHGAGEEGTPELVNKYKQETPGQEQKKEKKD